MTPEQGISEIGKAVEKQMDNINEQVIARSYRIGNALRNAEMEILKGQRSGKRYKRPGVNSYWTASAPGEPPTVGPNRYLRRSFRPDKDIKQKSGKNISMCAFIESNAPYAEYLEDGTRKMAPRPYGDKVKEKALPEIERIVREIGSDK